MKDNLDDILNAVSEYTGVSIHDILHGRKKSATMVRGIMCHLLKTSYPSLRSKFVDKTLKSPDFFYKAADTTAMKIKNDPSFRILVNHIRRQFRLVAIKTGHTRPASLTRTLFGFDYTDDDIYRRGIAIRNADVYMRHLCRIGRQPLEDGKVFTVTRQISYRNWYKDNII